MTLQLRTSELNWREIDGDIVALDARGGNYLAINAAGALLWSSLVSGATREQLIERLIEAYGIDAARATADTDAFVLSLTAHGLLQT
jgi:hypothetical protein